MQASARAVGGPHLQLGKLDELTTLRGWRSPPGAHVDWCCVPVADATSLSTKSKRWGIRRYVAHPMPSLLPSKLWGSGCSTVKF